MKSEIGFGIILLLNTNLLPYIKQMNKLKLHRSAVGAPGAYRGWR
jgi:hypothetical protein